MIGSVPIISFDTSAHNRLVDDGPVSEAMLAGLRSLFFRFVGLSVDEMVATRDPVKRGALITYCSRIQLGQSDCIHAHGELIARMVVAHSNDPASFDWKGVNVRFGDAGRMFGTREFVYDEIVSAEQRAALKKLRRDYDGMFSALRPKLEAVLVKSGEVAPPTFREALGRLEPAGLPWRMGKLLYDRAVKTDASETTIRSFLATCPPFRALIMAMLMSWYDRALSPIRGEKFEAGRSDMFMAVHLPYCDRFITAEKKRVQEKCLREVVAVTGLETEILSYDDFCDSFLVSP
jgi:hypothetical protein